MASEEVKKQIKKDVRNYYQKSKRQELGGTKTVLYDELGKIVQSYMRMYEEGYIKKEVGKTTGDIPTEIKGDIDNSVEEVYSDGVSEGSFREIEQIYKEGYLEELRTLVDDLFRKDADTVNKVMRGVKKGKSIEKEYIGILHRVRSYVPDFHYVRYLTGSMGEDVYDIYGTPEGVNAMLLEVFIEDIEWIMKNKTRWFRERTEEYFRYFRVIDGDPRVESIAGGTARGIKYDVLDNCIKGYIYSNGLIIPSITSHKVDNKVEKVYIRKMEEWVNKATNDLIPSSEEMRDLYLGTWIVLNSAYRVGKGRKVTENIIKKLLQIKKERDDLTDKELKKIQLRAKNTGVAVISIGDVTFLAGTKVVVIKGIKGERKVVRAEYGTILEKEKGWIKKFLK